MSVIHNYWVLIKLNYWVLGLKQHPEKAVCLLARVGMCQKYIAPWGCKSWTWLSDWTATFSHCRQGSLVPEARTTSGGKWGLWLPLFWCVPALTQRTDLSTDLHFQIRKADWSSQWSLFQNSPVKDCSPNLIPATWGLGTLGKRLHVPRLASLHYWESFSPWEFFKTSFASE